MRKINQTLHSEMDRLITEKSRHMSGSGDRGRLSSLMDAYVKKETMLDSLISSIEKIKSDIKLISEQNIQLEVVGNTNIYNNERLNGSLQDLKQVSGIDFCIKNRVFAHLKFRGIFIIKQLDLSTTSCAEFR